MVKIGLTFRVLSFLMAVLIFSMPVITCALQNPIETQAEIEAEARVRAIADAENDTNKANWFMAGCFLSVLGVAIANVSGASVPSERLIGKSPAYVVAYTSSYQAKRNEVQVTWALRGCAVIPLAIVGCVVGLVIGLRGGGGGSWCGPFF